MSDLGTTIHNERTKLLAGALDRASTASFTVGVLVPIIATLVGLPGYSFGWRLAMMSLSWFFTTLALHFMARRILGRLRQ
jgi:VIT1/CCC1 family predicted Fe2+/Mn2+ transporter